MSRNTIREMGGKGNDYPRSGLYACDRVIEFVDLRSEISETDILPTAKAPGSLPSDIAAVVEKTSAMFRNQQPYPPSVENDLLYRLLLDDDEEDGGDDDPPTLDQNEEADESGSL